jgi:hypothetical protein
MTANPPFEQILIDFCWQSFPSRAVMIDWSKILEESPMEWLLEKSNPSVRYFALRDLLSKPQGSDEIVAAKKAIPQSATVRRILDKQDQQGYWEEPNSPYLPKYKSSYWTIMVLSRLGMDKTNEKVAKACEFIFRFQHGEGGFSSDSTEKASMEYENRLRKGKTLLPKSEFVSSLLYESQLSCLTGNMAAALIRLGYEDDLRIKKTLRWLVKVQNKDGGWLCPYWKAHVRDKHACFMGTICPTEAFSEVSAKNQTKEMKETVSGAAEFMLMHRLFKADHHNYSVINKTWLELSYPWFGYNILRGLDVLTKLGYSKDERLCEAAEVLLQKRQGNGAWILENSPEGRMQANIEQKGQPSKWVTLIALRVLKRLAASK